jgi:hypothetical protein
VARKAPDQLQGPAAEPHVPGLAPPAGQRWRIAGSR